MHFRKGRRTLRLFNQAHEAGKAGGKTVRTPNAKTAPKRINYKLKKQGVTMKKKLASIFLSATLIFQVGVMPQISAKHINNSKGQPRSDYMKNHIQDNIIIY